MNGIGWVDGLAQDFRYAWRRLRQSAGFAAVVSPPWRWGSAERPRCSASSRRYCWRPCPTRSRVSWFAFISRIPAILRRGTYLAGTHFTWLRDHASSFEDVAALDNYSETGLDLVTDGHAQRLRVLRVTSGYFRTLRSGPFARPRIRSRRRSRYPPHRAERRGLADAPWRRPSVIGTTLQLERGAVRSGRDCAAGLRDPIAGEVDAWVPYTSPEIRTRRIARWVRSAGCETASAWSRREPNLRR